MKPLRTSGCVIGALLCFLACSSDDTTTSGGLALTIATDGVAPDRVSVKVSSDTSIFLESELTIATAPLPRTVNVKASGSATVVVQAWSGSTPLDRRDVIVTSLPKDGFAPLQVLLSAKCTAHAHAAADGSITSDCAAGTTCDPSNGSCGGSTVIAETPDSGTSTTPDSGASGCTAGATRCNALNVEKCSADGQWLVEQTCAFVCKAGACTGTCMPGHKTCCATVVVDGQPKQDCDATRFSSVCIVGSGTCTPGSGSPTSLVVTGCDDDGNPMQVVDCSVGKGTLSDGTVYEGCGTCPDTRAQTCFKMDGSSACIPN